MNKICGGTKVNADPFKFVPFQKVSFVDVIANHRQNKITQNSGYPPKIRRQALHIILRKDIRQLIMNADKVQKDLEMLERNHGICKRSRQQNDLSQLIKHVKNLESNVTIMLSDCVFLGRQHWKGHNLPLIHSLRRSNVIINRVLKDLKKNISAPGVAFTNSEELRQTATYWGQFKKSLNGIQKSVNYTRGRRKNHAWARKGAEEL